MSVPPKPWESASTQAAPQPAAPQPVAPPPIPAFNDDMNTFGSFGGGFGGYQGGGPFASRYGGMNYPGVYGSPYGGYGSYGGYGGYGHYNNMFGGYGAAGGESDIARLADESTRSAFQSVEHVVQAVSGVSMMLESTYCALYSSFRAVIGVADHLSTVSAQLSHMIASLSIIRTLRWIIRRTLQVLGIVKIDPAETAWNSASLEASQAGADISQNQQSSSWPILAFFSVVVGAPYLLYKMFGVNAKESAKWASGEKPHYKAVALYDFIGRNDRELSFTAGTDIRVAPKNLQSKVQGWLVASVDGQRTGLVPYNYLKIGGLSEGNCTSVLPQQLSISPPSPTSCADPKVIPQEDETEKSSGGSPTSSSSEFVNISMSEVGK